MRLSSPLDAMQATYDAVVVGTGYGGSIAAARLASADRSVCVLERGIERQPGDYPDSLADGARSIRVETAHAEYGSPAAPRRPWTRRSSVRAST